MTRLYTSDGSAEVGDILAFVDEAVSDGADAAVPAARVPVLAGAARLSPVRSGDLAAYFLFPAAAPAGRQGLGGRVVAALLLALVCPLLLVVAALVWLFDGRPVFFSQERYGTGGRPFRVYKVRTMVPHAAGLHGRLQARHGKHGRLFKLERDPRVTRTGFFLRRTFLDELPQLVNVVRGDMRLVGPRPLPASDNGHYTHAYHRLRLDGPPGLTGLWQVSGRNARTFDEMCLLDAYYLRNRSWALDARIVWRTLGLLLQQIGLKRKAEGCGEKP